MCRKLEGEKEELLAAVAHSDEKDKELDELNTQMEVPLLSAHTLHSSLQQYYSSVSSVPWAWRGSVTHGAWCMVHGAWRGSVCHALTLKFAESLAES